MKIGWINTVLYCTTLHCATLYSYKQPLSPFDWVVALILCAVYSTLLRSLLLEHWSAHVSAQHISLFPSSHPVISSFLWIFSFRVQVFVQHRMRCRSRRLYSVCVRERESGKESRVRVCVCVCVCVCVRGRERVRGREGGREEEVCGC